MPIYVNVSFKIESELLQQLDAYAMTQRKNRSEVIREAVRYYLDFKKRTSPYLTTTEL